MIGEIFPPLLADNTKVALIDGKQRCSYAELQNRVTTLALALLGDSDDLHEERVAFFMPASVDYVATLLGIWAAGGIAVPLNVHATEPELAHCLSSAGVKRLITDSVGKDKLATLCRNLGINQQLIGEFDRGTTKPLPPITGTRRAMMLFTSGTTSKPKGVVSTHSNIKAQISTLVEAWHWSSSDCIPLFLPLHHIHGIINVLCCALSAGASVYLYPRFDAGSLLAEVKAGTFNVFMAVPTIYIKIIEFLESQKESDRQAISQAFGDMRLNVSGSAACPVNLFNQWQELTGQVLLERYGMTEIGMAISNPYLGERRAGYVGLPLPGVEIALFDDQGKPVKGEDQPGEIRVRGNNVFLEYWNNPEATQSSFIDGWFCTGDIGVVEKDYYRIMGRASVDIIKSGGYKLSALEIEAVLLTHEAIAECAVIGIEDATWGEAVTAYVVLKSGSDLDLPSLKLWCDSRLSAYKIPKALHLLESLPRNAMGKVIKPALKNLN